MCQYTVKPGDSPATIARDHAGCPKCSRDLIAANPHKSAVGYGNGYITFESLEVGEKLNLPDKWSSAAFDALPPSYFAALPSADGVTPSRLGALAGGVLSGFSDLETAAARIGALASMGDADFASNVGGALDALTSTVAGAPNSQDAGIVRAAVALAQSTQGELVNALAAGDSAAGFAARTVMLHSLSEGLSAARRALESVPVSTAQIPPAVAALASFDPCSQANVAAVCATQAALGLTADGKYGDTTAARVRSFTPSAPAGCSPRPVWWAPAGVSNCFGNTTPKPPPVDSQLPIASSTQKNNELSTGAIVGIVALGAGAIGTAIYLSTRPTSPRVHRVPSTNRPTRREIRRA